MACSALPPPPRPKWCCTLTKLRERTCSLNNARMRRCSPMEWWQLHQSSRVHSRAALSARRCCVAWPRLRLRAAGVRRKSRAQWLAPPDGAGDGDQRTPRRDPLRPRGANRRRRGAPRSNSRATRLGARDEGTMRLEFSLIVEACASSLMYRRLRYTCSLAHPFSQPVSGRGRRHVVPCGGCCGGNVLRALVGRAAQPPRAALPLVRRQLLR